MERSSFTGLLEAVASWWVINRLDQPVMSPVHQSARVGEGTGQLPTRILQTSRHVPGRRHHVCLTALRMHFLSAYVAMARAPAFWQHTALGAACNCSLLAVVPAGLLLGAVVTTRAQTVTVNTGSCFIKVAYQWKITKTVGNGPSSGTTLNVRGLITKQSKLYGRRLSWDCRSAAANHLTTAA